MLTVWWRLGQYDQSYTLQETAWDFEFAAIFEPVTFTWWRDILYIYYVISEHTCKHQAVKYFYAGDI